MAGKGFSGQRAQAETGNRLLTETEASDRLNVPVTALRTWRSRKEGPPYAKLGTTVRYRATDIEAWIAASIVDPAGIALPAGSIGDALAGLMTELRDAPDGRPMIGETLPLLEHLIGMAERELAVALASGPMDRHQAECPDGTVALEIMPHVDVEGATAGSRVAITFDPESGSWRSDVAAPWHPGFLGLARHVFRLRDPRDTREHAAYRILGLLGAVYLKSLFGRGAAPAAPSTYPSLDDLAAPLDRETH